MSDWTIQIPIAPGEMLHVDGDGVEIFGYRVVSEDQATPQTVVSGIMEALQCVHGRNKTGVELMEQLADVSASVCDEMKSKGLRLADSPWRKDRRPAHEDANTYGHVWALGPAKHGLIFIGYEAIKNGEFWAPYPRPKSLPPEE